MSNWLWHYRRTLVDGRRHTLTLSAIGVGLGLLATLIGLSEAQAMNWAAKDPLQALEVSLSIDGIRILTYATSALAIRVLCIHSKGMRSHWIGTVFLLFALGLFVHLVLTSNQGLREVNRQLEAIGELTGHPPFFVYGTSAPLVVALTAFFFASIALEIAFLFVSGVRAQAGK